MRHEHYTPVDELAAASRERQAYGTGQSGGLFALPDDPSLGAQTWAQMSGVHPDSPLVGGRGSPSGGIDPDFKYRKVALASPAHQPVGQRAHATEILNFKGSPMPWILIAALAYLGLAHLHVNGRIGPYRGSAGVNK